MPAELRSGVGDWLFGCDVCQEVCPWNRFAPVSSETKFAPLETMNPVALCELLGLTEDEFRRRFRKTPLWRPHRRGLLRNAAIVLGNQRDENAVAALSQGLNDAEPIVRGACAWALGRIGSNAARNMLRQRKDIESDDSVKAEIAAALDAIDANAATLRMLVPTST
jgi:epoxyqueuosine reductase